MLNDKKPVFWIVIVAAIVVVVLCVIFLANSIQKGAESNPTFKGRIVETKQNSIIVSVMEDCELGKENDFVEVRLNSTVKCIRFENSILERPLLVTYTDVQKNPVSVTALTLEGLSLSEIIEKIEVTNHVNTSKNRTIIAKDEIDAVLSWRNSLTLEEIDYSEVEESLGNREGETFMIYFISGKQHEFLHNNGYIFEVDNWYKIVG